MDWFSSDNELDEDDDLLIEASQAYEDSLDHYTSINEGNNNMGCENLD